jgi:hypothetical protein
MNSDQEEQILIGEAIEEIEDEDYLDGGFGTPEE